MRETCKSDERRGKRKREKGENRRDCCMFSPCLRYLISRTCIVSALVRAGIFISKLGCLALYTRLSRCACHSTTVTSTVSTSSRRHAVEVNVIAIRGAR